MKFVNVSEFLDSKSAVSPVKGLELYEVIKASLLKREDISISFAGIEDCTTAFCNASIGKIYIEFGKELVDTLLHFKDYGIENEWLLKIGKVKTISTQNSLRQAINNSLDELINN